MADLFLLWRVLRVFIGEGQQPVK
ncbi:hypothetical protein YPPY25_4337, partial [Yersinia pestis PY-25]